jgi:hypothetical protein
MRLDHISYVATHNQIADTIQRLGARLGSTFVDGGIHPSFGTRNFTTPLLIGQYLEVVCPLDHPATELTPWGQAVSRKAREGGGWFTWVFSTTDLYLIEEKFGRNAILGHRTKPDGSQLNWKQIGVKEIADTRELPFFIEWLSSEHPSKDGTPNAAIEKIVISDSSQLGNSYFRNEIFNSLGPVTIEWTDESKQDGTCGIVEVHLSTQSGVVVLD